ncbi:DoxX family protein [Microlunatus capsulatus]|uniref:Membrane protein YphA (DoxX/SURF4 family) n=1 Tax=Microlunatus capsulatus TaxID=99117 RepID=A0ABS4Z2V2_9ACTN|nr:DoxX family protein [Microlunatus capsulatus]MBP2415376.1 putative membrane protein YphA (DoxX/SURF4 family) [Microlunatus capsulatus]
MQIASVVMSVLLAAVLTVSAVAKLARVPAVVESITGVGWPASRLWVLAVVELAGAAGLLVGLAVPVLGLAAAVGAALYFVAAVVSHLRLRQSASAALGPLAIAVATVVVLVLAR